MAFPCTTLNTSGSLELPEHTLTLPKWSWADGSHPAPPQGTLQKFLDDLFKAILSIREDKPPLAVKYFFDFLEEQAEKRGISDPDTLHIWKTNRLVDQWGVGSRRAGRGGQQGCRGSEPAPSAHLPGFGSSFAAS